MRPGPDFFEGHALYETLLVERGRIAFGPQHFARLRRSAAGAGFPPPPPDEALVAAIASELGSRMEAMRVNLRLDARGLRVASREVGPDLPGLRETGAAAITIQLQGARHESAGHKWVSRGVLDAARERASEAGAHEGILVTPDGYVLEGATSNVFCVSGSGLRTPPTDGLILPGVTRAQVCDLGYPVDESPLGIDGLVEAREIFLTSAVRMIVPVISVDGRAVGDGRPGPVSRSISAGLWRRAFSDPV